MTQIVSPVHSLSPGPDAGRIHNLRAAGLLDLDPDLGAEVAADSVQRAAAACRVRVVDVAPGPWDPAPLSDEVCDGAGLLLVDGAIARRVGEHRRSGSELLGAGDLVRPWEVDGDLADDMPTRWHVVQEASLALLDRGFLARAGAHPALMAALFARQARRARTLTFLLAIAHHKRVEDRLLMLLWHLADRWGRVGVDGVRIPLRLHHQLLADLVCSQRQTVTTALGRLERGGSIRRENHLFVLLGPMPGAVAEIQRPANLLDPAVGQGA